MTRKASASDLQHFFSSCTHQDTVNTPDWTGLTGNKGGTVNFQSNGITHVETNSISYTESKVKISLKPIFLCIIEESFFGLGTNINSHRYKVMRFSSEHPLEACGHNENCFNSTSKYRIETPP